MGAKDINYYQMFLFYCLLVIPFLTFWIFKIKLFKQTIISILRMTVQLSLVALYLGLIFKHDNFILNFIWILIMLVVANYTVIRNTGLNLKIFFLPTFIGLTIGALGISLYFLGFALKPEPFYTAPYLIPITGMVLGNSLRANVISLERFYSAIKKNQQEYLTYLTMGATLIEAVQPYFRDAVKAALMPTISTMSAIGIVALPGMMTGQILGGSVPVVAIKYQIAIMLTIFAAITTSALLNILFSLKVAFTNYLILKNDIFN